VWRCPACGGAFRQEDEGAEGEEKPPSEAPCPTCEAAMTVSQEPSYTGDPRKTAHFLRRLAQSSQHLLKVVSDLLDFAKIDAGRMRLSLSDVDVAAVLDEVAQTVLPLAEDKGVGVSFPPPGESVTLRADRVKLAQVFVNLVDNAIKFTEPGGSVTIGLDPGQQGGREVVSFWVKDTGIGIPADKHEAIFESFRQLDGGHTRRHLGTGLGLAITRRLVELHGGSIEVESRVGEGSLFSFTLPARAREETEQTPGSPASEEAAQ
jgi:signal transduction histidine kinase